jgi:hypothetical protein
MKNPIFWVALVAGNLAAAWIILVWLYTFLYYEQGDISNVVSKGTFLSRTLRPELSVRNSPS